MNAREKWLKAGRDTLASEGPAGLKIDRLAARLGVTKGSFHHHFAGAAGYRLALLDDIERRVIESLDDAAGLAAGAKPRDALARLTGWVGIKGPGPLGPELEVSLRAWAVQDDAARRTQERIDAARLRLLTSIWVRITGDETTARTAALLPHLIAIGAGVLVPPLPPDELRRVFELILPLVPQQEQGTTPTNA